MQAIWANKFIPGLLDWYLARTGYDAQQHDGPEDPNRPNNLWEPAPGDSGVHGAFDDRATDRCFQLWATTHRSWVALSAAGLVGATWAALRGRG